MMTSSPCCALLSGPKSFLNKQNIGEQDLLSNVDDDCLLAIFDQFNHNDLDVLSHVSQKLGSLAAIVRPRKKVASNYLEVFQTVYGDICVDLYREHETSYFMCLKNQREKDGKAICTTYTYTEPEQIKERRDSRTDGEELRKLPCWVYGRIRYLTDRFSVADFYLNDTRIDRNFLKHFDVAFNFKIINCFEIREVEFKENLQPDELRGFLQWILSKAAIEYVLGIELFRYGVMNREFLESLVTKGKCEKLDVYYDEDTTKEEMQVLPSSCYHLIPKFKTILLEVFVVDAEHLIGMIIKRFELNKEGKLCLSTTNPLEFSDIESAIVQLEGFEYWQYGEVYKIKKHNWIATIEKCEEEHFHFYSVIFGDYEFYRVFF